MNAAIDRFINYWRQFSPARPPYVHPSDAGHLVDGAFELKLLPMPVIGDIRNAEIIVLMLNPGLDDNDYLWEQNLQFREVLVRCIQQSLEGATHPFFYLDPRFAQHPGAGYWIGGRKASPGRKTQQKLRAVTEERARQTGMAFAHAQKELASRVAVLQQLPYHSRTLNHRRLIRTLPSCMQARSLVASLVQNSEKLIVVPRSVTEWGFQGPLEKPNLVVYAPTLGASASLTPRSRGGAAILSRLLRISAKRA